MEIGKNLEDVIDELHVTGLGAVRIQQNLQLNTNKILEWCKEQIKSPDAKVTEKGKNWYVEVDGNVITINRYSYTIITAHKLKQKKN